MKIDALTSAGTHLILKGVPTVGAGQTTEGQRVKTLGESPPVVLDLKQIGTLAALFKSSGLVTRLRKRLNYLKKKNCKVVPAKGTTVCVDDKDVVYLGVDFLQKYKNDAETLAGVLAHEWGHACALKPNLDDLQQLSWNQIFELRRAHETLADETSGRLLFMMGFSPEGLIGFLNKGKDTHNLKYHHPKVRARVIRHGYEAEKKKAQLAKQLFPKSSYKNEYQSILLDIA